MYALEEFRTAAGGNKSFPAIGEFTEKLKANYATSRGKPPIAT
jgi:hypothetical protein